MRVRRWRRVSSRCRVRRVLFGTLAVGLTLMTIGCWLAFGTCRRAGVSVEGRRAGSGGYRRAPVVRGGKLRAVLCGEVLVLRLDAGRLDVLLMHGLSFLRVGTSLDAARATVEAGVACIHDGVVHDDVAVDINVGELAATEVGDGAVVEEVASAPLAAVKAYAAVTKAVVNAAIETDVRAPVTAVEEIDAAFPAPVGGRPEEAFIGWHDPDAGNPVVTAVIGVSPVSGRPDVAVTGADGLSIDGKYRRCETYGDNHGGVSLGRGQGCDWNNQRGGKEHSADCFEGRHFVLLGPFRCKAA